MPFTNDARGVTQLGEAGRQGGPTWLDNEPSIARQNARPLPTPRILTRE